MKKKRIIALIFLIILLVVLVLLFFSDHILPNKLKGDVASSINSRKSKTIKVATFNIGSWKCGDSNQGATCKNNNNTAISKLIKDKGIDIIGIQEAGEHLASYRINELASMSNMDIKYVQPLQINAILSKYKMTTSSSDQYLSIPSCSEERALIKQVINVDGILVSFYNTHLSYEPECNEYHFKEMAKIVSKDKNPIILTGDYNRIPIDYFNKYLKPLGFEVAAYDKNFSNKKTSSYADAIFIRSKGQIEVLSTETINTFNNYSDHNMVVAKLSIKEPSIKVTFHYNAASDNTVTEVFNKSSSYKKFGYKSDGNPIYPMTGQYGAWNRAGYKLLGWSHKNNATKAEYGIYSGVADYWIEDNEPEVNLYAVWEPYKLSIKYDVNGGTLKEFTNSKGQKISKNGSLVTINGNTTTYTLKYKESLPSTGLADYNNSDNIYITKNGYTVIPGKEYKDKNGKEYSQTTAYKSSDFSSVCDVSKNSCEIIFYVNWKKIVDIPSSSSCKNLTYNGNNQTLVNSVEGYTWENNTRTNAGSQTITAKLKQGYTWNDKSTGNKTITCQINAYNLSNASVTSIPSQTYTGSAITPKITVTALNKTLTLNTDYTLSYKNNTDVGTATVTITGKGNYTGTKSFTFAIAKKSITVPTVSNKTYSGSEQTISAKTGYTLTGTVKATSTGTYNATAKLSDKANTKWSDNTTSDKTINWAILPYNISNSSISSISDLYYTGSAITPKPKVTALSKTLELDKDYKLSYKNNTNVGTATITVTGKGNYTGTKSITFNIKSNKTTYSVKSKDTKYYNIKNKKIYVKLQKGIYKISVTNLTNSLIITGNYDIRNKNNKVITGIDRITTSSKLHLGNTDYQVIIYGDVDKDGSITMSDLYEVYKHIKKKTTLTGEKFSSGDYTEDSKVDMADLYDIYKKIKKKS